MLDQRRDQVRWPHRLPSVRAGLQCSADRVRTLYPLSKRTGAEKMALERLLGMIAK